MKCIVRWEYSFFGETVVEAESEHEARKLFQSRSSRRLNTDFDPEHNHNRTELSIESVEEQKP